VTLEHIGKALVVDDDEVARNLIANYLRKMGVVEVELLETGDAAWEAVQATKYDLLVLDWKLPGMSGLALFNRIRSLKSYRTVPLLVVSGFLEQHDFRLLQEYPCTALMEKPLTKVLFDNKVGELMRESEWYGQNVALVDTIMDAVHNDDAKIEALLKQVLKKAPNPIPLAVLASRRMIRKGMLKTAEKVLRGVLKVDDTCIVAMSELGKVLHLMGRHKQSLEVLRHASNLSPQNLSRLCLMGEVELNLKDPESAKAYFDRVLEIDDGHEVARAGVVVAENMAEALESPSALGVATNFASLMNTMGIAYVRNGQYARGVEQYRSAIAFLHSTGESARVAFNLGLGYLRWGKPSEALGWFQRSSNFNSDFGKSAGYVARLISAGGTSAVQADMPRELDMLEQVQPKKPGSGAQASDDETKERDDSNVIPFPVNDAPKKQDDDEVLEETVGSHEMVLNAQGLGNAAHVDEEDDVFKSATGGSNDISKLEV